MHFVCIFALEVVENDVCLLYRSGNKLPYSGGVLGVDSLLKSVLSMLYLFIHKGTQLLL